MFKKIKSKSSKKNLLFLLFFDFISIAGLYYVIVTRSFLDISVFIILTLLNIGNTFIAYYKTIEREAYFDRLKQIMDAYEEVKEE